MNENNNLVATTTIEINATPERIWDALTNPDIIKQYMFGTTVSSTWQPGARITWKGSWKGKDYEDKGQIVSIDPPKRLQYTHFSPLSGEEDKPEHYHTVTIDIHGQGGACTVSLTQDGNADEAAQKHSEDNWNSMLTSLKETLESRTQH